MRKWIFTLLVFGATGGILPEAHAIQTASSFDVSYSYLNLGLNTLVGGESTSERSLTSFTGAEIDYNVAMFDYKTVATVSFAQYQTSNIGNRPLTRIALGASYHFIHVNGQRVILDNGVEGKTWGISPALELTLGLSYLSINDPNQQDLSFTSSMFDLMPRFLLEIPASPSFLVMVRLGYLKSFGSGGASKYNVTYSGFVADLGFKLTTF